MGFPTPVHVRSLSQESFVLAAWDLVGRRVNKRAKLEEIWEIAGSSVALHHAPDSLAVEMFRVTLKRYQDLNQLRASIEERAEQVMRPSNISRHYLV
jgi:hypothetical protein